MASGIHDIAIGSGVEHMGHISFGAGFETQIQFALHGGGDGVNELHGFETARTFGEEFDAAGEEAQRGHFVGELSLDAVDAIAFAGDTPFRIERRTGDEWYLTAPFEYPLSSTAVGRSTAMPRVCTAAKVNTVMVIAAPAILMVAPNGIDTE